MELTERDYAEAFGVELPEEPAGTEEAGGHEDGGTLAQNDDPGTEAEDGGENTGGAEEGQESQPAAQERPQTT